MKEILTILKIVIRCGIFGIHDYTCLAAEGIPPTKAQREGGVEGFWDYAQCYCKKCGKIYPARKRYERNRKNGG
jgi:hypothetical protein